MLGQGTAEQSYREFWIGLSLHSSSGNSGQSFCPEKSDDLWAPDTWVVSLFSTLQFVGSKNNVKGPNSLLHSDLTECSWQRDFLEASYLFPVLVLILSLPLLFLKLMIGKDTFINWVPISTLQISEGIAWSLHLTKAEACILKSLFWVPKTSCLICPREAGCGKQTLRERSRRKLF